MTKVTCTVPNVWTSKGKLFCGDEEELPYDEAKALGSAVTFDEPKPKAKAKK